MLLSSYQAAVEVASLTQEIRMSVVCPMGHVMGAEHAFCPACGLKGVASPRPGDAAVLPTYESVGADPLQVVPDRTSRSRLARITAVVLIVVGFVFWTISATHSAAENTAQTAAHFDDNRSTYTCSAPVTPSCTAEAQAQADRSSSRSDADHAEANSQGKTAHAWSVASYLALTSGASIGLARLGRRFGSRQRAPRPVYVLPPPH
jgi:hypothetical protein